MNVLFDKNQTMGKGLLPPCRYWFLIVFILCLWHSIFMAELILKQFSCFLSAWMWKCSFRCTSCPYKAVDTCSFFSFKLFCFTFLLTSFLMLSYQIPDCVSSKANFGMDLAISTRTELDPSNTAVTLYVTWLVKKLLITLISTTVRTYTSILLHHVYSFFPLTAVDMLVVVSISTSESVTIIAQLLVFGSTREIALLVNEVYLPILFQLI